MLLYRFLNSLFAVVVVARALVRRDLAAVSARLGRGEPDSAVHHVWLHGASNGELNSVKPVLDRLIAARPDLHWLVTCNSETGSALVAGWGLPRRSRVVRSCGTRVDRRRDWCHRRPRCFVSRF